MRIVSLNAWCGAMLEPLVQWLPRCATVTHLHGVRMASGKRDSPQRRR